MKKLAVAFLAITTVLSSVLGCESSSKGTLYVYYDGVIGPVMEEIASKFERKSGYKVQLMPDPEDRAFRRMKLAKKADVYVTFTPFLIQRATDLSIADGAEEVCSIMPTMITAPLNPHKVKSIYNLEEPDLRLGLDKQSESLLGVTMKRLFEKNGFDWEEVCQAVYHPALSEESLVENIQDCGSDVAIVWESTARQQKMINVIPIKPSDNVYLPVMALALKKSEHPEAAIDFVKFMRSPQGQAIWKANGFRPLSSGR